MPTFCTRYGVRRSVSLHLSLSRIAFPSGLTSRQTVRSRLNLLTHLVLDSLRRYCKVVINQQLLCAPHRRTSKKPPLLLIQLTDGTNPDQIIAGIAQPIFQVIGPRYSELWFDLKGRGSATTILAISNTIGAAVAQLVSPSVGGPRSAVLVLGIVCTVLAPCCFIVGARPPTPPSTFPLFSLSSTLPGTRILKCF